MREQNATVAVRVEDANAVLKALEIKQRCTDAETLKLDAMRIGAVRADTAEKQVEIGKFSLEKPQISLMRDKTGRINVAELVVPKPAEKTEAAAKTGPAKGEAEWTALLKAFAVNKASVAFEDRVPLEPVRMRAAATLPTTRCRFVSRHISRSLTARSMPSPLCPRRRAT